MTKCNVLILGKSGCGKSSLVNYLFDRVVSKVGTGTPVTPCGIYPQPPITRHGLEIVIHDTWGMEADKATEWRSMIEKDSLQREASGNLSNWFHSILYCISAARIEPFEIESVIRPLVSRGYTVIFILTKSDITSDSEKKALKTILQTEFPQHGGFVEICSTSQKLRNGKITLAFGSNILIKTIISGLRNNLLNMIKRQYILQCQNKSNNFKYELIGLYNRHAGFFTLNSYCFVLNIIANKANTNYKKMSNDVESWLVVAAKEAKLLFRTVRLDFASEEYIDSLVCPNSSSVAEDIRFGLAENYAIMILNIVPGLNVLHAVFGKELHRDELERHLNNIVFNFMKQSNASLELIHKYLSDVMQ